MWVYQFGYLDEFGYPVSRNYALDELRRFGDRPVWINPLWFWECHSDAPQGSARNALAAPQDALASPGARSAPGRIARTLFGRAAATAR
jgi:hypothetical protein